MPRISRYILTFSLIIVYSSLAYAFSCDLYGGFIYGPGSGLDIGAKVWTPIAFNRTTIGLEFEGYITDCNYTSSIKALRGGLTVRKRLTPELSLNGHFGQFNLKSNRNINLRDLNGNNQVINANTAYKGLYGGVSIDYIMYVWDVILTPKLLVNNIEDKGSILEFDLNIAKSF